MRRVVKVLTVVLIVLVICAGCSRKPFIGNISSDAPVTAVVYESGQTSSGNYSGIVYREIVDTERMFDDSTIPLLIAYIDDSQYSGNAISFVETIADDFKDQLLVVRVNVEISDNPEEVSKLVQMFDVNVYPFFSVVYNGVTKGIVPGYNASSEKLLMDLIRRTIDKARND